MNDLKEKGNVVLVAIVGCAVTLLLNHGSVNLNGHRVSLPLKLGPVVASSLVGLIGGFLLKKAAVNHSASFAGMSSMIAIATLEESIMVGAVVGIVYILLQRMFAGVGGKLGTIAMVSTLIIATVLWPFKPYSYINLPAWTSVTPTLTIACIFTGGLGSLLTILLREKAVLKVYKSSDAVIGSTLAGLIGGFLLPQIPTIGRTLSLVFYEGSFAGMSSRKRLPGYAAFFIAGALSGALFILLYGLFPGCGGKLGFMAFSSVLIFQSVSENARRMEKRLLTMIRTYLSMIEG